MIERIFDDENRVLAIIIRKDFDKDGIEFLTPDDYPMQMAYMHHKKGHEVVPHVHNNVKRAICHTSEVLVIKSGALRCDFYSDEKKYIKSVVINTGDIILLVAGGHGFECLQETEMIEIKQGPYAGEKDKVRF